MVTEFLLSAAQPEQFPDETLPEVAFLGRSNVGKSSLLNRLVQQKGLAFTSAKPGRTRVINFYRVDGRLRLVDLPGYGYARVPKPILESWKRLVEAYLTERQCLELAILLLDARRGWMDKDRELKRWLEFHGRPYLVVATKIDLLNQREERRGLAAIAAECTDGQIAPFSALTGRGVREIWQAIWKTQTR